METDLVALMFTQFKSSLASFISNDISVALLAMLSLMFIVFAYFKIREIFNIGLDEDEIVAKNAFGRWQQSKGTWREPLMYEEYRDSISYLRDRPQDLGNDLGNTPYSPTLEQMMNDNKNNV